MLNNTKSKKCLITIIYFNILLHNIMIQIYPNKQINKYKIRAIKLITEIITIGALRINCNKFKNVQQITHY